MAHLETPSSEYSLPRRRPPSWWLFLRIALCVLAFATVLMMKMPGTAKGYIYTVFREAAKNVVVLRTWGMSSLEDGRFIVKYTPGDEANAMLVLESAQRFYDPVALNYNMKINGKIPIIVYPSKEELNASFGWSANESAMGVYWAGVIRVLSPEVWINDDDRNQVREVFINSGPMAHELTHLVVDYATRGNIPRWFTEGLAQLEEYRLTGFRFDRQDSYRGEKAYRFTEMDRNFDALPDQGLAYWQSLAAVEYMIESYGEESVHRIIDELATGSGMDRAMKNALGLNLSEFELNWQEWAGVCRNI